MIELRVLGGLELSGVDERLANGLLVQKKAIATLVFLALDKPGAQCSRETLAAKLWPEQDDPHARNSLRHVIKALRDALGEATIVGLGDESVGLAPGALWCDAVEMDEAVAAGRYARALELYFPRGKARELLPGFLVPQARGFDEWLSNERMRLQDAAKAAAWALASRHAEDGEQTIASRYGRSTAKLAPSDERMIQRVMTLLERLEDRAGALYVYEEFARQLKRDYEAEPSARTRELYDKIRWGRLET